jgi:acyl-CoA thioester hydrolase
MARNDFNFFNPVRVRYSEVDAQGIVYNSHYLTYFDSSITEYLRHLKFDYNGYVGRTGEDFHLVKGLVNYEAPIYNDQEIEVACRVSKIGRTSLTFTLEIYPKASDERQSSGEVIWVNTDQASHKSVPLRQDIIDMISKFDARGLEQASG